eukprot:XP_011665450.1 PREDICTED: uncharacterized protein LOC105438835 [Strongylocentrotus purpuratus]
MPVMHATDKASLLSVRPPIPDSFKASYNKICAGKTLMAKESPPAVCETVTPMSSLQASSTAGPLEVTDDLIYSLAADVETVDHLDALGIALGFDQAARTRFHSTNNLSGSVGCRGTRDMLTEWRQRTPGADKSKLKRALQKARLIELSEKYLPATDENTLKVEKLRRKLKNRYKQELCHLPLRPWDKDSSLSFKRNFVDVDLYEQGQHCKCPEDNGTLNDLLKMACNVQDHHYRFAILANAGCGKSMLAAKIAYDWSHELEGSPLRDVLLLFVIKLRLLQEGTALEDAIMSQLLVGDEEKYSAGVLKTFIEENQSRCMLVFDGCDEYIANILAKDIKSDVVSVLRNHCLQECPTVITSRFRHQRSFTKASQSYVKMELRGFTLDNAKRYIRGFFHDQRESGEKLRQFLDSSHVVCQLVQIPLFCVMVCDLWQQDALEDVQTQTGLLNQVIQFLWHHWISKKESSEDEESSYSSDEAESAYASDDEASHSDDEASQDELQPLLLKLGKMVLDLHLKDNKRTVFSEKDFKCVRAELKEACRMGLMSQRTVTETRMRMGKKAERTEIQFYHKLAQEHIASSYLVSLPPETLEETLSKIKDYKGIHMYENLLRFTCGLGAVSCAQVLQHLLGQLWVDQPLPPNKNATFRLALDFLNECPEVSDAIKVHLETMFQEKYLCLYAATPSAIQGLQKLPQSIKNKIRMMRFQSSEMSESSCLEFIKVLPSFRELQHLGLRGVNASEPSLVSIVESARRGMKVKGVLFRFCCTSKGGALSKYLEENNVAESSPNRMRVLVHNENESDGTFYVPRTT